MCHIVFFLFLLTGCQYVNSNQNHLSHAEADRTLIKQKGAHLFGPLDTHNIKHFIAQNFNWITLVPFASQDDHTSAELRYMRGDSAQWEKRKTRWLDKIDVAHAAGMKVFLKPHIWMHEAEDGKWRSDIFPDTEADWIQWQKNYRAFILAYARIAEESNVALFCIGTELSRLSKERSEFWEALIVDVRKVYSGQLTYAANWYKEYEDIQFWAELDYIGVQAYFPLVDKRSPSLVEISEGWDKYLPDLRAVSEKHGKHILFTEVGYKSTQGSAIKPWEWVAYPEDENKIICNTTQSNCYLSFFEKVWNEEWMAGVHIWQLRTDDVSQDPRYVLDFTPQLKPAMEIIRRGFQ